MEDLINVQAAQLSGIPVIKRFTGGGTVVVDQHTVFSTLIFSVRGLGSLEYVPRFYSLAGLLY